MFLTLLGISFVISFLVSGVVAFFFHTPLDKILKRIISDDISSAWLKYLTFAIYVVGVSSGVSIYELEKYITPERWREQGQIVELTGERWVLEVYRTIIETLQGIAWMLLVFFIFALIAYVIVRIFETRRSQEEPKTEAPK